MIFVGIRQDLTPIPRCCKCRSGQLPVAAHLQLYPWHRSTDCWHTRVIVLVDG